MDIIMKQFATDGELAMLSTDVKLIIYVYVFSIILMLIFLLIGSLKGLGK